MADVYSKNLTTSQKADFAERTVTLGDVEELQPRLFETLLDACCLKDKLQKLHGDIETVKLQEDRIVKFSLCEMKNLLQPLLRQLLLDLNMIIETEQMIEKDLCIVADSIKDYFRDEEELDEDSDEDTGVTEDNSTHISNHVVGDDDHAYSLTRERMPQTETNTSAETAIVTQAQSFSNRPVPLLGGRMNEESVEKTDISNGTAARAGDEDKPEQDCFSEKCLVTVSVSKQAVQKPCHDISPLSLAANTSKSKEASSSKSKAASFECGTCGKRFSSSRRLRLHLKIHTINRFTCAVCSRVFKYAKSLSEHMNIHNGLKPYKCDVCNEKFPTSQAVMNHTQRIHSQKYQRTTCQICGMRFKNQETRNTHYLKHTEKERAEYNIVPDESQCDQCGKVFRTCNLSRHKARTHVEQQKGSFICEICGEELNYKGSLLKHMWKHKREDLSHKITTEDGHEPTKDSAYVCRLCHRAFSTQQNLKIHKYSHAINQQKSSADFDCQVCGKKMTTQMGLNSHMNIHLNLRPFACTFCDSTFRSNANLRRHVLTVHKQVKSFKCSYCDKSFGQKVERNDHENIHTGAKPYECNICGQKFSDRGSAGKHKARHGKEGSGDTGLKTVDNQPTTAVFVSG